MADIATSAEVKANLGITDASKDAQITALLPGVSRMIEGYTRREFTNVSGATSAREYFYDGNGVLEIGDTPSVASVELEGRTLSTDEYILGPQDELEPVYYWLDLATFERISPAMGFMYNLDRLWPKYRAGQNLLKVTVTAPWGFPTDSIPADIKLAASWLVSEGLSRPGGAGVASESIADYAVSFAQGAAQQEALPERVTDILDRYRRVLV